MRILLDECVPKALKRSLRGAHRVLTVAETGWKGLSNGALVTRASEQFEVFITVDASIQHQRQLASHRLIFVVLRAAKNDIAYLAPLVHRVLAALETAQPGQVIVIGS